MLRLIFLQEEHKMDSQNETAQLRYLEETSIRLRRMDFETMPAEDQQLPVKWNGSDLCRISGKGSVLYRQECVDSVRAQDALQSVIDTAKTTSEYMAILETAPLLKAGGLHGDYRVLADFGDAVLAGHPTERGVQFVTWEWDFDREGVHHGHYFQNDEEENQWKFTERSTSNSFFRTSPAFSRSRCRSLFAAIRRTARIALTPATVFSAGARMGPACGAE